MRDKVYNAFDGYLYSEEVKNDTEVLNFLKLSKYLYSLTRDQITEYNSDDTIDESATTDNLDMFLHLYSVAMGHMGLDNDTQLLLDTFESFPLSTAPQYLARVYQKLKSHLTTESDKRKLLSQAVEGFALRSKVTAHDLASFVPIINDWSNTSKEESNFSLTRRTIVGRITALLDTYGPESHKSKDHLSAFKAIQELDKDILNAKFGSGKSLQGMISDKKFNHLRDAIKRDVGLTATPAASPASAPRTSSLSTHSSTSSGSSVAGSTLSDSGFVASVPSSGISKPRKSRALTPGRGKSGSGGDHTSSGTGGPPAPDFSDRNRVLGIGGGVTASALIGLIYQQYRVEQIRRRIAARMGLPVSEISPGVVERMLAQVEQSEMFDDGHADLESLRNALSWRRRYGWGALGAGGLAGLVALLLHNRAVA